RHASPRSKDGTLRSETFRIPPEAIEANGRLVLALRVYRDPALGRAAVRTTRRRLQGPFALGPPGDVAMRVELESLKSFRSEFPPLSCASLLVFAALYHLNLYRKRRELTEYAWFAVIAVVASTNMLITTPMGAAALPQLAGIGINTAALHLNTVAW